jgi:two-component system sensor histidine kinase DegS
MNQPDPRGADSSSGLTAATWRESAGAVAQRFPLRLRDRRFWITQALVIAISAAHTALEATHHLGVLPDLALLPVSTYFIPVVYAALKCGVEGAVPTALWCALLSLPNVILWHTASQRPGVLLQLALLVVLAYVIARRVDVETEAKERAQAANTRLTRVHSTLEEYVRLATDAQEEERKRLARELHDDTIQTLVLAKAELDAIATEVPIRDAAGTRLKKVESTLAGAIDGVRRFSRDLRPSLLDDLGLVHAIDSLVADLSARTGIQAQLRTTGPPRRLRPNEEVALFRILQEALHNVERHSEASRARVRIHFDDSIRAVVTDNGKGLDLREAVPGADRSTRLGLLGMRERAKLAGAELTISSRPRTGTRVAIEVKPRD